jgi:hypothetical protein
MNAQPHALRDFAEGNPLLDVSMQAMLGDKSPADQILPRVPKAPAPEPRAATEPGDRGTASID